MAGGGAGAAGGPASAGGRWRGAAQAGQPGREQCAEQWGGGVGADIIRIVDE